MNARGIRARGAVVVLTLLTLGATACGSRSAKSTSATQRETSTIAPGSDAVGATSTTTSGGETTTTAAGGAKTGHVGDTLINPDHYVPADVATVTLVKIIDPATQLLPKGVTIIKVGYSTRTTDASRPQEIYWTVP